jgi:hypothetical protein
VSLAATEDRRAERIDEQIEGARCDGVAVMTDDDDRILGGLLPGAGRHVQSRLTRRITVGLRRR